MNETQKSLIYLLSCSVNGIIPDKARVQAMDMEKLYALAKKHSVQGAVCIALERAGIRNDKFYQAYKKAIRKNIFLDAERAAITADFEKQGIWYMPLKGSVLKDLYPEIGMRQMADNDMLFDSDKQYQVKEIMEAHGYKAESVGVSNHDIYMKPPVLNFELHRMFFGSAQAETLCSYYSDVKRLLKKLRTPITAIIFRTRISMSISQPTNGNTISTAVQAYAHFSTAMFTAKQRVILLTGTISQINADSFK